MPDENWRLISFRMAADNPPPAIDFCLPNLVAGTVGVVAAEPGIGKTSLLMQLGAAVAAGISVAGGAMPAPERTGAVVFLAAEDPPKILERRAHFLMRSLDAQGCDNAVAARLDAGLRLLSLVGYAPVILHDTGLNKISMRQLSSFAKGTRLLILDPIRRFHWCNEQDYGKMALLFQLLVDIAVENGCTVLFSHHLSRFDVSTAAGEADMAQGISAFVNPTRWVLNLHAMSRKEAADHGVSEDSRRQYVRATIAKSNYGPPLGPYWLHRSNEFEGIFEQCHFSSNKPGGNDAEVP